MKPADIAREIAYPLSRFAVIVPMTLSWLLFSLALVFRLFGLLLFLATLVPFLGYLMSLLDARANDRDAPAFDAELMAFFGNVRALLPLLIAALFGWLQFAVLQRFPSEVAVLTAAVLITIFPASLGVLSITRSALHALSPPALMRFIQTTGLDYLLLILTLAAFAFTLYLLRRFGVPGFPLGFGLVYWVFLLYSLTGEIIGSHQLNEDVEIPAPLAETPVQSREKLVAARETAVSHAYGFVSRGNRTGGLAHIQTFIDGEQDQDEASNWFFNEMLKWENTDAALFFAQGWLHRLLSQKRDAESLKIMSQCYHANPRFRPAKDDRDAAIEAAKRNGRNDLLKLLS